MKSPNLTADIERSVLGAILLEPEIMGEVATKIGAHHFGVQSHQMIFGAMIGLSSNGAPIDYLSIADQLGSRLRNIGGMAYLSTLTEGVASHGVPHNHISKIREAAQKRALSALGEKLASQCLDPATDAPQAVLDARAAILAIAEDGETDTPEPSLSDQVSKTLNRLHTERFSERLYSGFETGLPNLDAILCGIRRKELVCLGAQAATGKSAFASQIACHNARDGQGVAFFSLEMSSDSLLSRILAAESGVPAWMMRQPRQIVDAHWRDLESAAVEISKWPLFIDETGSLTLDKLLARARHHVTKNGVGLVIVDHIGLVEVPKAVNKEDRVSTVSNGLRNLAKQENVAVILLAHVSRAPDKDPNRRPVKSDLRDSAMLENHAHIVLMPYRPINEVGEFTGQDEIIIAKARDGEQGPVQVKFDVKSLRYKPR